MRVERRQIVRQKYDSSYSLTAAEVGLSYKKKP